METLRDITLTIMAVLVSVVCALLIYAAVTVGANLAHFGDAADEPAGSYTDCTEQTC